MDLSSAAQLTLTLSRLLGQDVVLIHALSLESRTGFLEPLCGPAVNFCFRHVCYSALALTDESVVVNLIGWQGIHGPLTPFFGGDHHCQLSAFHFGELLDISQFGQIGFYSLE